MRYVVEQKQQETILVTEDGFQQIAIKDCDDLALTIKVQKHIHASLFLTYTKETKAVKVQVELEENAMLRLLHWNQDVEAFTFSLHVDAKRDAQAVVGIGDLMQGTSKYSVSADLKDPNTSMHLISVMMAEQKHLHMQMHHQMHHTYSQMENFAIVQAKGDYNIEAIGQIDKGAYESMSHQSTRVLTMSQDQKAEVLPVLKIDEADVKASHATTLGQPDEAQLYYLQSRGLSRKQALGLLTLGYLMPICKVIEEQEVQEELQRQIEEKVMQHVAD